MSQEFKGFHGRGIGETISIGEKNQYFGRQFSGSMAVNTVSPSVYPSRSETSCSGIPCG